MDNAQISPASLHGLSFSIAELTLISAWAEAQGLQMRVRLDHGSETEEYEEVLAFDATWGRPRRHIMWRDHAAVYVEPLTGRTERFQSVADAFAMLTPSEKIVVTDVMAPSWPA